MGLAATTGRAREGGTLALASGLAFSAADLQAARASSRVYLVDAALHALLLTAWFERRSRS